jgi:hypothetical protein
MPGTDETEGGTRAGGPARGRRYHHVVLSMVLLALALVMGASPAAAHGDARLIDGRIVLAPGESVTLHESIHYHRLIGRVAADGPVRVRLVEFVTGAVVFEAGPANRLTFNRLIRCCLDAVWSPYTLMIDNPADRPVTVRARAVLVHDDLAVMVDGAEAGTTEGAFVMTALWIGILWWGWRRSRPTTSLRRLVKVLAALGLGLGGLALYGWARYGDGGVPGLIAGLSHVPAAPWNPVVSRISVLLGAALIAWGVAGALWAKAGLVSDRLWLMLGGVLAAGIAAVAFLIVFEYGWSVLPVGMAVGMIVPLFVLMALRSRAPAPSPAPTPASR